MFYCLIWSRWVWQQKAGLCVEKQREKEKLKRKWRNTHTHTHAYTNQGQLKTQHNTIQEGSIYSIMQIDMWFIWKTCTAIGNGSLTTFFFFAQPKRTHESPNMHSNGFSFFFLSFFPFSGFLSPYIVKRKERGDTLNDLNFDVSSFFVFELLFWCSSNQQQRNVADCLKGPINRLQITSGLAFAKRPYAKIENAKKNMEKGELLFRVDVFLFVENAMILFLFWLFAVAAAAATAIQNYAVRLDILFTRHEKICDSMLLLSKFVN